MAGLIEDCHIPHHHYKAYNLTLKILHDIQPDEIIIKGDFCDMYWVSNHRKDPRVILNIQDEIKAVIKALDDIDMMFPRAKKVYLEGNHENRLDRYIQDKCVELWGIISYTELVGLHKRHNWTWIPYEAEQKYQVLGSNLFARHVPQASNAKATVQRALCNITWGHTHRREEASVRSLTGETFTGWCGGWLGDARKNEVFGYTPAQNQWQLGSSVVYYDEVAKIFYKEYIDIKENMTAHFGGKLYKG